MKILTAEFVKLYANAPRSLANILPEELFHTHLICSPVCAEEGAFVALDDVDGLRWGGAELFESIRTESLNVWIRRAQVAQVLLLRYRNRTQVYVGTYVWSNSINLPA